MSDLPELHLEFWLLTLTAKGTLAIVAAVIICFAVLGLWWFRLTRS
ncbi:hypothetical protein RAD15_25510 [Bradyrhizobium sp. 14AA]